MKKILLTAVSALCLLATPLIAASTVEFNRGDSIDSICKVLQNNDPKVTEVKLRALGLTDADAAKICTAMENNDTLTKLNLEANEITEIGGLEMEKLLVRKPTLQINLSWNRLCNNDHEVFCSLMSIGYPRVLVDGNMERQDPNLIIKEDGTLGRFA